MPSHSAQTVGFAPRLSTPRLAPIVPPDGNAAQRDYITKRANYNIFKTYAHHLDLVRVQHPFGIFALKGSSLPARDRELVILRMGWLCQAEYEWSQHSRIAKALAGLTDADLHRIAQGPDAEGWSDSERAVLRMVDELRYQATISDATWQALRAKYSDQLVMELLLTAGQYQFVSMFLNSLGIQLDPELKDRLPRDLKLPALAERPTAARPGKPRIVALAPADMTPEQRELVKPQTRDGKLPNLYATLVNHPKLYGPYLQFDSYVQHDVLLPPKTRELLILRTAWNTRDAYGWAHHAAAAKAAGFTDAEVARAAAGPSAEGWNEEQLALLRAADALHRDTLIPDAVWQTLASYYDKKQMVDILAVFGGYAMTGMLLNSVGVRVEPGYPTMPKD